MVLFEYIPYGDLLGYLRRSRGLHDTYYNDADSKPASSLTSEQLLKFAREIAEGMNFLSERKVRKSRSGYRNKTKTKNTRLHAKKERKKERKKEIGDLYDNHMKISIERQNQYLYTRFSVRSCEGSDHFFFQIGQIGMPLCLFLSLTIIAVYLFFCHCLSFCYLVSVCLSLYPFLFLPSHLHYITFLAQVISMLSIYFLCAS